MDNIKLYEEYRAAGIEPLEIRYELRVYADDQPVFFTNVPSEELLMESLLKVDHAIDAYFQQNAEIDED
jgi:hypothetical protein